MRLAAKLKTQVMTRQLIKAREDAPIPLELANEALYPMPFFVTILIEASLLSPIAPWWNHHFNALVAETIRSSRHRSYVYNYSLGRLFDH
jgi:hypothetical protein